MAEAEPSFLLVIAGKRGNLSEQPPFRHARKRQADIAAQSLRLRCLNQRLLGGDQRGDRARSLPTRKTGKDMPPGNDRIANVFAGIHRQNIRDRRVDVLVHEALSSPDACVVADGDLCPLSVQHDIAIKRFANDLQDGKRAAFAELNQQIVRKHGRDVLGECETVDATRRVRGQLHAVERRPS